MASWLAARSPGVRLPTERDPHQRLDPDLLVVRGPVDALDELVVRLVGAGVGIRELRPVLAPLEAAFLALTGDDDEPTAGDEGDVR